MSDLLVIVTDAHQLPKQSETWQKFIRLIQSLPPNATLISLGDFFDIWYAPLKRHKKDYSELLEALKQAVDNKINIHFLAGNRDFLFLPSEAKSLGIHFHDEPFIFNFDHKQLCLIHGDILLTGDIRYQKFRQWIRSPLIHFLAKHLPAFFADFCVNRIRHQANQNKAVKPLNQFDVDLNKASEVMGNCSFLICGHTHVAQEVNLKSGKLIVLPAFGDQGEYLHWERGKDYFIKK